MTTTQPRRPARGAGGATQAHCRVSLLPLSATSVAVALELTDAEQRPSECMSEVLDDACRGIPAGTELHGHLLTCSGVIDRRREMGRTTFADVVCSPSSRFQVVVSDTRLPDSCRRLLPLLLRPGSRVRVTGFPGRTRTGMASLFASDLALLSVPLEPASLILAARLAVCGAVEPAAASAALGIDDDDAVDEVVHALETDADDEGGDGGDGDGGDGDGGVGGAEPGVDGAEDAAAPSASRVERLARRACARLRGRRNRERPPRFSAAALQTLGRLSAEHAEWTPRACTELAPAHAVAALLCGPLDPERGIPAGVPRAEGEMRLDYLRQKKVPQLRWMLLQVEALVAARQLGGERATRRPLSLVDVGCGKGDFTLLLAAWFPAASVLGIDTNASAVSSATERARAGGLANVRFECSDASALLLRGGALGVAGAEYETRLDVLVALHACGGLSDVALSLAARRGASALVCTCCFNKHRALCEPGSWGVGEEEKDVLCRVADCVDTELSSAARRAASCLRLARLRRDVAEAWGEERGRQLSCDIVTFPEAYSRQNFCLRIEARP